MDLKRVLVLGATGGIGAHAVRALLAAGWTVRALVRPSGDTVDLAALPVELVQGDLRDAGSLERALAGCAAFVHCAGFYPSQALPRDRAVEAGLASVSPVFDGSLAAGVRRGVYVSSMSTIPPGRRAGVAGRGAPVGQETDGPPWSGGGAYFAAKAAMEREALESVARGLDLAIVNPTLCLGEYDRKPTTGRIVLKAARGRFSFYVEAPVNVVYTGDVGLGIARALESGRAGERYILGGTNTTYGWLLRQIAYQAGARPPGLRLPLSIVRAGVRVADAADRLRGRAAMSCIAADFIAHSQHFDTSKAVRELRLPEPTPAVETVRRTVRWFEEIAR